jgi:elongation factor Ts
MAQITASAVKELREETNISMMECKKALQEADGDKSAAIKLLRERGMVIASKKASRETNEGLILTAEAGDGTICSLVEVNCETDFVARNETFRTFADSLARRATETDDPIAESVKDDLTAMVTELGENIIVPRNARFILDGPGVVRSYIHLGNAIGVLIEVGCEKAATALQDVFKELVRDLTLHIAACSPRFLTSDEIPAELVDSEREIYAKQMSDKPAEIIDKIIDGKIRKFYSEVCFVNQSFVKDPDKSITDLLADAGKALDDTLTIRRFVRYQIGE